jgi:hypothetical protein
MLWEIQKGPLPVLNAKKLLNKYNIPGNRRLNKVSIHRTAKPF